MMPSYEFENGQLREENNALRHSRNAAQQRAEQAERERDEAREVIDRAIEILGSPVPDGVSTKDQMANEHLNVNALLTNFRKPYHKPQPAPTVKADAPLEWTPKTGAEIVADMEGRPAILPPDFDIDAPAPTVKAAEPLWRSMTHLVGVGEISYSDTMNLVGHRLRIAHDCINQSETQTDAALEQMHHALVLLYHALDLRGGAS